jgi:hypothetical protein
MNMKKKFTALMVITVLVAGLSINVVGVLPVAAALVSSGGGAWYSTDGGPNFFDTDFDYSGFRGIAQEFSVTNKIDTLNVFSAGKYVPAKSIDFQYDGKSGKWYAFVAKNSSNANSGVNLGAAGYFWYQYMNMNSTYRPTETDPGKQYSLEFEDGAQHDTNVVSSVPIPGAALLLVSGLLGLVWLNQRRSKTRYL